MSTEIDKTDKSGESKDLKSSTDKQATSLEPGKTELSDKSKNDKVSLESKYEKCTDLDKECTDSD